MISIVNGVAVLFLGVVYMVAVEIDDPYLLPVVIAVVGPFILKGKISGRILILSVIPFLSTVILAVWHESAGLLILGIIQSLYIGVIAFLSAKVLFKLRESNNANPVDAKKQRN